MSIGNDVVDLDDVECRLDGLHPRWADRVFAAAERGALERTGNSGSTGLTGPWSDRHRLVWALWAAKESAYKARKRCDSEAVFSPREYVVELPSLPPANGVAEGRVVHRGHAFAVEVRVDGACLHAVATGADEVCAPILRQVATAGDDPGRDVRRLAATTIASALGLDPTQLQIAGRPPVILHDGEPIDATVSLSHHGRFVAFACTPADPCRTVLHAVRQQAGAV